MPLDHEFVPAPCRRVKSARPLATSSGFLNSWKSTKSVALAPKDAGGERNGIVSRREADLADQTASDPPVADRSQPLANRHPANRLHPHPGCA